MILAGGLYVHKLFPSFRRIDGPSDDDGEVLLPVIGCS